LFAGRWVIVFTVLLALPASANSEQSKIFAVARGGWQLITEDMHRQFWQRLSDSEREAMQEGTSSIAGLALIDRLDAAYQGSIYETRASGMPTKVPKLEALRRRLLELSKSNQQRASWQDQFAEQDKYLASEQIDQPDTSAPHRDPFALLNNKEAIAGREELLLNPAWNDTPRDWPYPPMRLTLHWPYRWSAGCGPMSECKNWVMNLDIGDTGAIGVHLYTNAVEGSVFLPRPGEAFSLGSIDYYRQPRQIGKSSQESEWRGYRSIKHITVTEFQDAAGMREYRVCRVVLDPGRKSVWLLIATSSLSVADAETLFAQLEGAITLQ
jgi:hypothetical protein